MNELFVSLAIMRGNPDSYSRSDSVLFILFVSVVILGYHDYGTSFHGSIEKALNYMKEANNFYSPIGKTLYPLSISNGPIEINEEEIIFLLSFYFLRQNNSIFLENQNTLMNDDHSQRLTGSEAHKVVRERCIRMNGDAEKLLPQVFAISQHILRAKACFNLWFSALTTKEAIKPALEDSGYKTMVLSNEVSTLVMILSESVVFDGHKLIELNRAQTLGDVPPSLVEPVGAAADRNNGDIDIMNDDERQERNTELEARATRGDRPRPTPTQWSDLKVNDLKNFIRHQQSLASTGAIQVSLRLTKPKESLLQNK